MVSLHIYRIQASFQFINYLLQLKYLKKPVLLMGRMFFPSVYKLTLVICEEHGGWNDLK